MSIRGLLCTYHVTLENPPWDIFTLQAYTLVKKPWIWCDGGVLTNVGWVCRITAKILMYSLRLQIDYFILMVGKILIFTHKFEMSS